MLIRTVLGDIEGKDLGWCQCHEHLFVEKGPSYNVDPALCIDDIEASMKELEIYKAAGGAAYVDAQPYYAGRMGDKLYEAADRTGVNIIAATGFHKQMFYTEDAPMYRESEEKLADFFIKEITEGLYEESRARAGVIKCAADKNGIKHSEGSERLFHAACIAAAETGAPLLVHYEKDGDAFEMLRLMERYGVAPEKLIACHLDRMRYDAGYHKELAAAGAWLDYDSVNRLKYLSHDEEIALIRDMAEAGYANKVMLALDTTAKRLSTYGADMGLDFILKEFRGMLNENGIDDATVLQMMVSNPANALVVDK